jgi:prolipoprotein diacylglyceryl transferase
VPGAMTLAYLPSPSQGVWHLGPFPVRGYALCIVLGILVCVWITERRMIARGAAPGVTSDIAMWAVPFGIIGGRLYHVITTPEPYFGHGGHPIKALYIWQGGLGIWGAIALGGLGAYIGARRAGVLLTVYADAAAPGILVAQAIGRFGNYFNQELYGRPSTLPWALRIDPANRPKGTPDVATYQPTFLYESLWCLGLAALLIWAERRFDLGHGRVFGLYAAGYSVGRGWIEYLRVDEAHHIAGLRLNDWTAMILFAGAVTLTVLSQRRHPGREPSPYRDGHVYDPDSVAPDPTGTHTVKP